MKCVAINTVYQEREKGQPLVCRPGTVVEFPDEIAEQMIELGAVRAAEHDDVEVGEQVEPEQVTPVQLPQRPSNSATKDAWFDYIDELEAATSDLGTIEVPEDAKRDDLIALGDRRVAEWNSRQEG